MKISLHFLSLCVFLLFAGTLCFQGISHCPFRRFLVILIKECISIAMAFFQVGLPGSKIVCCLYTGQC